MGRRFAGFLVACVAVAAACVAADAQTPPQALREYNGSTFVKEWLPVAGTECFANGNRRLTPSTPAACSPSTTTTTAAATTTTVAPAPTTTLAPAPGRHVETFDDLDGWTFAHRRYEIPANSDAPSLASVSNGAARIVAADQNYGDATLRGAVKYDLTSGGTVTLDIADNTTGDQDVLQGDAYVMFSANPDDAKAQMGNEREEPYAPADMPADALTVRLGTNCRVPWGPPVVIRYANGGRVAQEHNCAAAPDGTLRLVFTPGHLSVRNGADAEIGGYDVTVPSTGWIVLGVHNHASVKYGNLPAVVGTFDNVTYPTGDGGSAPTTTAAPATTSTTTTPAPTTTAAPTTLPPSTGAFSETFETDSRARFDWRLQTTQEPPTGEFLGQHDMACGPPSTHRTVHQVPLTPEPHTNVDVTNSELIWWCAPGNDVARGHMMTGLDTGSIATLSFSPKQTFTNVTKVCWDQNMDNLGEAKWVNVFVVPAADVAAHNGDLAYAAGSGLPFGGIPMMLPPTAVDFTWLRGSISANRIDANGNYVKVLDVWKSYTPGGIATESATRYTICLDSAANRVTLERPDGTTDTYPLGASFPTGPVRVIWQDASYNPTKHAGSETSLTWHWDNLTIDVG